MLRFLVCMIFCSCQFVMAIVLPNSQECSECHFSSRTHVEKKFPTGFGRWENAQCFGCHNELTEVATIHQQGKQDERFSSLPISDDRINRMERDPLPYLNAHFDPITTAGHTRTDEKNLTNFLRRPHGYCAASGVCSAPLMMAYPSLKKTHSFDTNNPNDRKHSKLGKSLFQNKCSGCHASSDPSRYNPAAMSLFSADWIYRYANNQNITKENRNMPQVAITKDESQYLHAYFQSIRIEKEAEVDTLAKKYIANFQNKNTTLPVSEINYMWQKFWRDGSCVHCHSIGGRATEKFDTSTQGIVTWLKNNDPQQLVNRLLIRHAEQQVGIGAEQPGMPMTGKPLSFTAITVLATWINMGCPDRDLKKFCAQQPLATGP
ncbi:MAG: hypothetical protein B0W54_00765 [Cellvibrio sp. 79]|nr:MAG: hypothetical protein B0W54_00765 [Cellvibrio sp. 79]